MTEATMKRLGLRNATSVPGGVVAFRPRPRCGLVIVFAPDDARRVSDLRWLAGALPGSCAETYREFARQVARRGGDPDTAPTYSGYDQSECRMYRRGELVTTDAQ